MLGELGRYPMLIPALKHCVKYEYHISRLERSSLVSSVLREMDTDPQIDCWKSRIGKVKTLLNVKGLFGTPERAGFIVDKVIKSKFDRFYLDEINQIQARLALMSNSTEDLIHLVVAKITIFGEKILDKSCFWSKKNVVI